MRKQVISPCDHVRNRPRRAPGQIHRRPNTGIIYLREAAGQVVPRPGEYRGLDSYPPDLWARKAQGVHRRTAYDDTKHVFAVACVLRLNGALAWPQAVSRMGAGRLARGRPSHQPNQPTAVARFRPDASVPARYRELSSFPRGNGVGRLSASAPISSRGLST